MKKLFQNRTDAGHQLVKKLESYVERNDVVVLALPNGGVPVAFEVAHTLNAPLDLLLVRKLKVPGNENCVFGTMALPDICVYNRAVIEGVYMTQGVIDAIIDRETKDLLKQNKELRLNEPPPKVKDRLVILIDDGMTTGASMRSAVAALMQQEPYKVVVAVPYASQIAEKLLCEIADEVVICHFMDQEAEVNPAYEDFTPISNQSVLHFLDVARGWGHGHVNVMPEHRRVDSRLQKIRSH